MPSGDHPMSDDPPTRESTKGWKKKQQEEKPGILKAIVGQLPALILGIVGAVLIALLLDKWAITEPRLVHTGGPMLVPHIIGSMIANGEMETFVKHAVPLKNLGFRSGHVDKVVLHARDCLSLQYLSQFSM